MIPEREASSIVFFTGTRTGKGSLLEKFSRLIDAIGIEFVANGDIVAIKLHFGADGCTNFLRPIYAREIVDKLKKKGAKPFLTDTCTFYNNSGRRTNGVDHLMLANEHGFSFGCIGAPIIIADGIYSQNSIRVRMGLKHFEYIHYASDIYWADDLVVLSHVKGSSSSGFGGAIKNLGMGSGTRDMKGLMHGQEFPPKWNEARCTCCHVCAEMCPVGAIVIKDDEKPIFNLEKCVGCGICSVNCKYGALPIDKHSYAKALHERMAETAYGILQHKKEHIVFFNFLVDITPYCDCKSWSGNPIVPNIGILASLDPVAIDQASIDLVNANPGLPNSALNCALKPGEDKFRVLRPEIDYSHQMVYGEEIGLGSKRYEFINIDKQICSEV